MKLKKIAAIIKRNKHCVVYHNSNCQWVSNGFAIYLMADLPEMNTDDFLTVFGVDKNSQDGFYKLDNSILPEFMENDTDDNERQITRGKISICYLGATYEPMITSLGTVYINTKYLAPFDNVDDLQLFERIYDNSVQIIVKRGFEIIGAICPYNVPADTKFCNELNTIAELTQISNYNATNSDKKTVDNSILDEQAAQYGN